MAVTTSYSWFLAVNTFTVNNVIQAGNQADPAVVALADGSYFSTWSTETAFVAGRIVTGGGGSVTNEFQVNTTTLNDQFDSDVAHLANDTVVVTFTEESADPGGDIRARLFMPDGTQLG